MRRLIVWAVPTVAVSVAVLAALAFDRDVSLIAHARAGDSASLCPRGDATLRGTYLSKGEGTVVVYGPVAFIGQLIYDGNGHVANPYTLSLAGTIIRATDTGSYTVNSDCTGTHTSGDGTQHYSFIVSPDGRTIDYIETDAGTIVSGSARRVTD